MFSPRGAALFALGMGFVAWLHQGPLAKYYFPAIARVYRWWWMEVLGYDLEQLSPPETGWKRWMWMGKPDYGFYIRAYENKHESGKGMRLIPALAIALMPVAFFFIWAFVCMYVSARFP